MEKKEIGILRDTWSFIQGFGHSSEPEHRGGGLFLLKAVGKRSVYGWENKISRKSTTDFAVIAYR